MLFDKFKLVHNINENYDLAKSYTRKFISVETLRIDIIETIFLLKQNINNDNFITIIFKDTNLFDFLDDICNVVELCYFIIKNLPRCDYNFFNHFPDHSIEFRF